MRRDADPSGQDRQGNRERQDASQHDGPEVVARQRGHKPAGRAGAENAQAKCEQKRGTEDGNGIGRSDFVERLHAVQVPDERNRPDCPAQKREVVAGILVSALF